MHYVDHLPKLFEIACTVMGIGDLFGGGRTTAEVSSRRYCAIVLRRRYNYTVPEIFNLGLIPGRSQKYIDQFEEYLSMDRAMQAEFTQINRLWRHHIEQTQEYARIQESKITLHEGAIVRQI